MISNIEKERPPLDVADEITQSQTSLLNDIERLKNRNRVEDTGQRRCADADIPLPPY